MCISSLNSLAHGLTAKGLLKCNKDMCAFRDICRLHETDEGHEIFELAHCQDCIERVELEGIGDDAWRHLWAMYEVRMMHRG